MNAYELADKLETDAWDEATIVQSIHLGIKMLRQQADRIAELEKEFDKAFTNGYEIGLSHGNKQQSAEPELWTGGEEWEELAYELCADEHGEESCMDMIWDTGVIPEPWGERWQKYEDEAKRMIAMVRKHTTPQIKELSDEEINEVYEKFVTLLHHCGNEEPIYGIDSSDVDEFARAILKKASEK